MQVAIVKIFYRRQRHKKNILSNLVFGGERMLKLYRQLTAMLFCGCSLAGFASEESGCDEECSCGPSPQLVRIRHIEPKGIGYGKGYSSLDLFLTLPNNHCYLVPFADLRGHVFNDGKFAANAGIGVRWFPGRYEKVFGVNAYYDYRLTSKRPYHQVSVGFEILGIKWDFRANGYLPVGTKRSQAFDFEFNLFPDNSFLLTAKRELAMRGANAEFGYYFDNMQCDNITLYIAGGPYFYAPGKFGKNTTGGQLRATSTLYKYLTLEANVSYDHLFKWIGQGAVSINYPFGHRKMVRRNNFCTCCDALTIEERLFQLVQHNEIIVIDSHRNKL